MKALKLIEARFSFQLFFFFNLKLFASTCFIDYFLYNITFTYKFRSLIINIFRKQDEDIAFLKVISKQLELYIYTDTIFLYYFSLYYFIKYFLKNI